jgi:glyoxalase family protein
LGYRAAGEEDGWHRFEVADGGSSRILEIRTDATSPRGRWGRGSVHHVAFRVPDEQAQLAVRANVEQAGLNPTPVIDRFWFRSVYFLEPGGVLFEIATDGPGFAVDEDKERLGERLVLPPWLESSRDAIEAALPVLSEV